MRRRYLDRSVLSLMPLAHFARHFPHSQIDVSSTITNGEYWLAVLGGQTAGIGGERVIGDAGHLAHALDVRREIHATERADWHYTGDLPSGITNGGRHQPEVVVANVAAHHPALSRTPVGRAEAVAPGLHSSILWWPSLRLNNHSLPHMKGIGQKTKFE